MSGQLKHKAGGWENEPEYGRVCDWASNWILGVWISVQVIEWVRVGVWLSRWVGKWQNKLVRGWFSDLVNGWECRCIGVGELVGPREWMNEQTDKWMNWDRWTIVKVYTQKNDFSALDRDRTHNLLMNGEAL